MLVCGVYFHCCKQLCTRLTDRPVITIIYGMNQAEVSLKHGMGIWHNNHAIFMGLNFSDPSKRSAFRCKLKQYLRINGKDDTKMVQFLEEVLIQAEWS